MVKLVAGKWGVAISDKAFAEMGLGGVERVTAHRLHLRAYWIRDDAERRRVERLALGEMERRGAVCVYHEQEQAALVERAA